MRKFIESIIPPGWDLKQELYSALQLGLVIISSWIFFGVRLDNSLDHIYRYKSGGVRLLVEGVVVSPFGRLTASCFALFIFYVLIQLISIRSMYKFFTEDSKSIYLMRRLPQRYELAKRCISLPLINIAAGFAFCMLQLLLFWAVYKFAVPAQAMPAQSFSFLELFIWRIW